MLRMAQDFSRLNEKEKLWYRVAPCSVSQLCWKHRVGEKRYELRVVHANMFDHLSDQRNLRSYL